ncbi:hypothetical protein ACS3SW_18990 [Roseobacteraceae bacterium S113]
MKQPTSRFLHRKTYRRRRMADAARLLPIAGVVLLLIPLLRGGAGSEIPASTSSVGLYVFGAWAVLIVVAWALARGLREEVLPENIRNPEPNAPSDDHAAAPAEHRS